MRVWAAAGRLLHGAMTGLVLLVGLATLERRGWKHRLRRAASIVFAVAEAASLSSRGEARGRWLGGAASVVAFAFGIALRASPGRSFHAAITLLGSYFLVFGELRVVNAGEAWRRGRAPD